MLAKMRGGMDSIFVTILLGILIAAFAIWGIGPTIFSGNASVVATVGDQEVSTQTYYSQVQQRAQELQIQFGGEMATSEVIRLTGLDRQVLATMIAQAALKAEASELGMRATDKQVAQTLREIEAFQIQGTFSPDLVDRYLASSGLTRKELVKDIRASIVQQEIFKAFTAANPMPRTLAEQLFVWRGERRSATLLQVGGDTLNTIPAPDEDTLTAYFETVKDTYKTAPLRSYRYILVSPDLYTASVDLTEEDIQAGYEEREAEYVAPELRSVDQATFSSLEAAEAFIQSVTEGADFLEEAARVTDFTAQEISLGDMTPADVSADFGDATSDAVFALAKGAVSVPIEGLAGYNVFRVTDITPGDVQTLESVRTELEALLKTEHAIDKMFDLLPEIEDALAEDPNLERLAGKFGLTLATVSSVDRRGQNRDGARLMNRTEEFRLLAQAYTQEVGDEAEILDINPQDNQQGYFLLEVTETLESEERSLDEVHSRVTDAWIAEENRKQSGLLAEKALERLMAGEDPLDIVESLGGTSFEARDLSREDKGTSNLSPSIRRLIFDLNSGQADFEQAADGNGYIIARVDSITPGDPASRSAEVDALMSGLYAGFSNELFEQYQTYLLDKFPPEVNDRILGSLFQNNGLN